ncbi:DUF4190 domain-containing protein [Streptomyces cocklensis]|uniref:DUF4190 domain-containing protein n=2 Tax=Actinacidiphila cocklensis TaxID=887465 RepID=A0A9W4DWQ8_9ACTN|nr:DUF4190 domain-containing protein [Actinacidiphila cocklensis]MDD1059218.1 DUF4190 domain-containing protein [Actinacidiphila cocklensis]WSX73272.1 DUF4190 domain-containing protein [Streptomyces sp. NBC_00899]WSX80662.1 DUF4190 domain-containing protein [Streptomyces sp. NBC_00899]CAG6396854.1 conserved hypothetical protein [Actinacidiphila cocklensis]
MNTAAHPVATGTPAAQTRDADGMAVASFLLGLPGLLVLNLVLGPAAIVLALTALTRGTRRRGRALLGLVLGVAGLVIQAVLAVAGHGVLWSVS